MPDPTPTGENPESGLGSASIEYTLLAGLLAILALGVVQLAFLGYAREAAGYAAHDALAEATAFGGNPIEARAMGVQMLNQLTGALHHPEITVRENAKEASVDVTGQSTTLLGFTQTITVTDTGPIETFGTGQ